MSTTTPPNMNDNTKSYSEKRTDYGTATAALADMRKWFYNPKRENKSRIPRKFVAHITIWVPKETDNGWNMNETVDLRFKDACKLVKAMGDRFGDRGGKIRLCFYTDDLCFIG